MSNTSIPATWASGPTLDLFYIKGRLGWKGLRASEFQEEGPFLITGTDFVGGKVDWSRSFHISDARFIESPEITVQPGDILITKDGTIGKVAFIERIPFPGKASLNSHLFLVRSRTKKIDQRFAFYIFQSYLFRRFIDTKQTGSTLSGLPQRLFEQFEVPLPPVDQQGQIAEILSTVDEAIEQTEALIMKYQQITAGLMHDLFTRGVTPDGHLRPTRERAPSLYKEFPLGWIPKEWSSGLLSDFLLGGPKNGYSPQEVDEWSGLYTLGLGCLTTEGFRPNHLKMVALGSSACHDALLQDGDFLLSRSNTRELVGLCGIYRDVGCPCIYPDLMMRIRPNGKTSAQFLEALLLSPLMRVRITSAAVGTSGSMVKVNSRAVLRLQLAMPEKDEQAHILNLIHAQRNTLMSLECDLAKLRQQKQGLMQDLLTGRVRVKVAEAEVTV